MTTSDMYILLAKAIHNRRSPAILLKIDIAKAFDTVSWTFLLEVLRHMGFRRQWRNWISIILFTTSTKSYSMASQEGGSIMCGAFARVTLYRHCCLC
jgi:hypothetical protein